MVLKEKGMTFSSVDEAIMAYETKAINIHAKINVKVSREFDGVKQSRIIKTTVGKIIFNESIPQNLGLVDRSNEETKFDLEVDFLVTKNH